jgi:fructose-bisphosphate aldolase class 1
MNSQALRDTVKFLFAKDKGILAMDESNETCNQHFEKQGISQTVEARRAYREMIVTTPKLGECIGGAILYDETIHQKTRDGKTFVKVLIDAGVIPGIKVDTGAKELAGHPNEKVTEGLDGLRARLAGYAEIGARFAKWRAVIAIGDERPSWAALSPTLMPWSAMQRSARRQGWCQSLSQRSSWTERTHWRSAVKSQTPCCAPCSVSYSHKGLCWKA